MHPLYENICSYNVYLNDTAPLKYRRLYPKPNVFSTTTIQIRSFDPLTFVFSRIADDKIAIAEVFEVKSWTVELLTKHTQQK